MCTIGSRVDIRGESGIPETLEEVLDFFQLSPTAKIRATIDNYKKEKEEAEKQKEAALNKLVAALEKKEKQRQKK